MREKLAFTLIGVVFLGLLAHRVWRSARLGPESHSAMPGAERLSNAEARRLYLTPAGAYTQEDIAANGRVTASEKYRGFRARHDFTPSPGDPLCPISRTKANPACVWVIGGQRYEFCCPPCIDEFVRLAKEAPQQIEPPSFYVQQE